MKITMIFLMFALYVGISRSLNFLYISPNFQLIFFSNSDYYTENR